MISSLRGSVDRVAPGEVIVDVGGVGYGVRVIPQLAAALTPGAPVRLRVSTIVREDAITLFGFEDDASADIFDTLLGVTGVGPRSALAVLAHLTPAQIATAVAAEDDTAFTRVSGIGSKTAKLICVQLAGKLSAISLAPDGVTPTPVQDAHADLILALVGLGWNERSAKQALASIDIAQKTSAEVLREALNVLGGQS